MNIQRPAGIACKICQKKCYDHNKTPGELINNSKNHENNDKSESLESIITDDNTNNNGYLLKPLV